MLPGYDGWYNDFWELGTDRSIGFSVGPIPAASIARHVAGWDEADALIFRRVIRAMDEVYLRHAENGGMPEPEEGEQSAKDAFRSAMRAKT